MTTLPERLMTLKKRRGKEREMRRRKAYEHLRKPKGNGRTAPPEGYCLELVDIEELRRNGAVALNHCEVISYEVWSKKARRSKKNDTWYLVLNPPEPFLEVTLGNVWRYLHGGRWSKRG